MREWLRQLREEKGLTQEKVASESYINRAYYSQIENGVRNPSFEVAAKIAETFDIDPSRFFIAKGSEPFGLALRNAPVIIAHCDLNLRYTWFHHPHAAFSSEVAIGKTDEELGLAKGIEELIELKRVIIKEGRPLKRTIVFEQPNGERTYVVFGEPLHNGREEINGVVTVSMDITSE
ncbi:helix-turn-helix domain-containing protein [Rossellomorea vietnamensis]|uniref:Helix-turn-helix domain-containing protein n=1 Tax=Rossellomorea vietnamensis TaxID=218284 RepID=A0A5D4MCT8_9BACI|nr:helix-turn-helix domain-containing protein [Rossellomorea vietnamensis]TYR99759.1 helix-turn-helix domain-containing protein [Rossellomorea vietnamensis]